MFTMHSQRPRKPTFDRHGVSVIPCQTNNADYCVDFYQSDHNYITIRDELKRNGFTITDTTYAEGGELMTYFVTTNT